MFDKWPIKNVGYALGGLRYVLLTQRNTRTLLVIALAALIIGVVLGLNALELAILVLVITLVIVAELINTALESVVDLAARGLDPRAKAAKDVASGAVLVTSIGAAIIGALLFIPHLLAR